MGCGITWLGRIGRVRSWAWESVLHLQWRRCVGEAGWCEKTGTVEASVHCTEAAACRGSQWWEWNQHRSAGYRGKKMGWGHHVEMRKKKSKFPFVFSFFFLSFFFFLTYMRLLSYLIFRFSSIDSSERILRCTMSSVPLIRSLVGESMARKQKQKTKKQTKIINGNSKLNIIN